MGLTEQHGKIPASIANSAKHQFDYREKEEFHVEKKVPKLYESY